VFLVHGRDGLIASRFKDLLRCVNLLPLEWEELVAASGSVTPYLGQVVASAPHLAQATLVLLSPDDIVELHPDLYQDNDQPYERGRDGQARPNVLFELGLALTAYPTRTIVVEVGQMRPVADLAGLNMIHFDGSSQSIKKVIERLKQAECPVDDSGTDWLSPERFAGLPTYRRGPGHGENGQAAPGREGPPEAGPGEGSCGTSWLGHE
jgi:predicted nucleotide-binding protein